MDYDVIVIGGGISGLTAASLLAKRGVHVAVIEHSSTPGGSCGIFKRGDAIFDQGSAMLYGFGEKGFNVHRFVFNCLEEPIDIIQHEQLYCVNFNEHRIRFHSDINLFIEELSKAFPDQKENIRRFYTDMRKLYQHVMVDSQSYTTADQTDALTGLNAFRKHPVSYIKFLSYLNRSAKSLLAKYFTDPEIFKFFDKMTSTYCYATVEEAPAVMAAVMFVDNHVGGSYYPAGSTLFLPGKLEKVIEMNRGDMLLKQRVTSILFEKGRPAGVRLENGKTLTADFIIYSGTVWNLYSKLIDPSNSSRKRQLWAQRQVPTYPSVVLYAIVDRGVIPEDTLPIEMIIGNPDRLDDSEVTAYLLSIDDRTLCADDEHVAIVIGPTFNDYYNVDPKTYQMMKRAEIERLIDVMEKRFPGFRTAIRHAELSTPKTIERYTLKNGGAVAGPKQMLGQHMFKRLHTQSEWPNLLLCGESTVMGTGTPTVTVSGLSAANVILKKLRKEPFLPNDKLTNMVNLVQRPFTAERLYANEPLAQREILKKAWQCRFCESPTCSSTIDVPGVMRRVVVGNLFGAMKCLRQQPVEDADFDVMETHCIRKRQGGQAVQIKDVFDFLNASTTAGNVVSLMDQKR